MLIRLIFIPETIADLPAPENHTHRHQSLLLHIPTNLTWLVVVWRASVVAKPCGGTDAERPRGVREGDDLAIPSDLAAVARLLTFPPWAFAFPEPDRRRCTTTAVPTAPSCLAWLHAKRRAAARSARDIPRQESNEVETDCCSRSRPV